MRKVTCLVFMAADNDLGDDSFAKRDLHEMEKYGSSEEVAVVVQVDRGRNQEGSTALRGFIEKNETWSKNRPEYISELEDIGETDTGDPAVLQDFIIWGASSYPAETYILVIWAHGTGWRADEIEKAVGKAAGSEVELAARSGNFGEIFRKRTKNLVFKRTMETAVDVFINGRLLPNLPKTIGKRPSLMNSLAKGSELMNGDADLHDLFSRAVALDTTDMSALDALELKAAIAGASNTLNNANPGSFALSVIGFDACLMGGVETLYQLRNVTNFAVASQEEEPRSGWRYDLVVDRIRSTLGDPEDTGEGLVDDYMTAQQNYIIRLVTQSAIQLDKLEALAASLDALGAKLITLIDDNTRQIQYAEKRGTRFRGDKDFIDLGHFVEILDEKIQDPEVHALATDVLSKLRDCVLKSRYAFERNQQKTTGLSVYFPAIARYDEVYGTLDVYPHVQNWVKFIKSYHLLD